MKKIFVFALLIISTFCFAQNNKRGTIKVKKAKKDTPVSQIVLPYTTATQMPMFPGGQAEMIKFINKNMNYPEAEKQANVQGTVFVTFIVETNGSITNSRITRKTPNGPGLDKEALRLISIMPKWIPGQNGSYLEATPFSLPIKFILK